MRYILLLTSCVLFVVPAFGQVASDQFAVQFALETPAAPIVGLPLTFTALVTDPQPGTHDYRFSVSHDGGPLQVVVDYNSYSTFSWVPSLEEGSYTVQVSARNKTAGEIAEAQVQFDVASQVVDGQPEVIPTGNPLVAFYSAPPCPAGSEIYVLFTAGQTTSRTDQRPCSTGRSNNFFLAGMLPNTTYRINAIVTSSPGRDSLFPIGLRGDASHHLEAVRPALRHPEFAGIQVIGDEGIFTTGSLPPSLPFPLATVLTPPTPQANSDQNILLNDNLSLNVPVPNTYYFPTATDLAGNVLWYYGALGNATQAPSYFIRPIDGGTFLLIADDPNAADGRGQLLREIDLAGNTIRETNATRVTEQLNALGLLGVVDFNHDAIRLPNGHTLAICGQEKLFPPGTQGAAGALDVIGDAVVDLDSNFQVSWVWSGFDHLDINRAAILGERCPPYTSGCSPVYLAPIAVDWMHSNSLTYIPSSGDLLLSVRHQDWVIKIDYHDGAGSGAVLWRLGHDGSFAIASNDPYPWFSHQHDVEYELKGTSILSLYDNGNTRAVLNPGKVENSRGMVLNIDESRMLVTPLLMQDLGVSSQAVGSAQRLDNGDYHFDSGFISIASGLVAQHSEFSLTGVENYLLQTNDFSYRSYRMVSLYQTNGPGN